MAVNGSHFAFVKNAVGNPVRGSCSQVAGYYWECEYSYGDGAVVISDADLSLPGFQVDLDEGENQFALHIYGGSGWDVRETWSQMYRFTVTRTDDGPLEESPNNPATSTLPVDSQSNPLTSLIVSPGTLTPTFARTQRSYTVSGVPSDIDQVTLHAMAVNGAHFVFLKDQGIGFSIRVCSGPPTGLAQDSSCAYGYQKGSSVLTDVDPSTPGFQVDLEGEETQIGIHVHGLDVWESLGVMYMLSITRAGLETQNSPATGVPTITGTAQVGETLTADVSGITDADGTTNAIFNYQWIGNDGSDDTDIQDATASTYELSDADVGQTIKVRVSFTDDADNPETLNSEATAEVAAKPNSQATGAPTISGTAQVGEALTASTSGIADADGLTNVSYNYQWLSSRDTEIQGAVDWTYTVKDTDEGKIIKVRVSFTDDADNPETLTSEATSAVTVRSNNLATGAPTISGTAQVDETLTALTTGIADADGLTNVSYSYQWIAGDADISGARSSTYTVRGADEGQTIRVRVSFTDDAGNPESLTSEATATVAARPNSRATGEPTITGTAQMDETLTAEISAIADADGLTNVAFSYQWIRNDGSDDTEIQGANASTYTLKDADVGKTIQVRVSFADDAGNPETLTSEATAEVAAKPNSPATGAPTISGTAQVDETLTANTSGIADADGLTNVSYSYQWIAGDTDIPGARSSTYTLQDADEGMTIQARVTFTDDAGHEETLISEATSAVAGLPPPPLTASYEDAPSAHDGINPFTFELRFSEEFNLSYKTLKFHAFTVAGGTVKKAQRLDKPSNIPWRITVKPDSNEDVTIVLPVTTDCNAQGAICTGDGRKLSNRLEFTVSGPGG